MNRLEQYIRDHKNLFDEEPPKGHFERLQQKLGHKHRKAVVLRWTVSVAASLVILLSVGIIRQYAGKQNSMVVVCENADDLKACYLDRMNLVAGRIEALTAGFDQWDQQQVMDDVQNIIYTVSDDFESELPEELPDHLAKAILSDYYRQNLKSLEMIERTVKNE